MVAQVKMAGEMEMFYSKNESEPLIDMICWVENGFEATQATIQVTHDAKVAKIEALVNSLNMQETERLKIICAVPAICHKDFSTNLVNPLLDHPELAHKVSICHMAIGDGEQQR